MTAAEAAVLPYKNEAPEGTDPSRSRSTAACSTYSRTAICYADTNTAWSPHLDSEQFRSAPKVPHAIMHKDLSCQRVTSRAFGDKGLFREVSKPSTARSLKCC